MYERQHTLADTGNFGGGLKRLSKLEEGQLYQCELEQNVALGAEILENWYECDDSRDFADMSSIL